MLKKIYSWENLVNIFSKYSLNKIALTYKIMPSSVGIWYVRYLPHKYATVIFFYFWNEIRFFFNKNDLLTFPYKSSTCKVDPLIVKLISQKMLINSYKTTLKILTSFQFRFLKKTCPQHWDPSILFTCKWHKKSFQYQWLLVKIVMVIS